MKHLHSWKVSVQKAIRIQENLRQSILLKNTFSAVRTIGGGDVSYRKEGNLLFGAMVIVSFPKMEPLEIAAVVGKVPFPYIPGLLSFREGPILIKAFQKLKIRPDIMIFDGQGIAHPRGLGLASHLGLWFDLPSIGCAKTPLLDQSLTPKPSKASFESIRRGGEEVGAVLRTKDKVRPVFVSPGHRVDLPTSIRLILESCQGFRIPEPLRRAHHFSRILREKF